VISTLHSIYKNVCTEKPAIFFLFFNFVKKQNWSTVTTALIPNCFVVRENDPKRKFKRLVEEWVNIGGGTLLQLACNLPF